jgi:hypothetical protein
MNAVSDRARLIGEGMPHNLDDGVDAGNTGKELPPASALDPAPGIAVYAADAVDQCICEQIYASEDWRSNLHR